MPDGVLVPPVRPPSDSVICDPDRCDADMCSPDGSLSWGCRLFLLKKNHTLPPATIAASGMPRPMPTPRPTFVPESSSSSDEELEVGEVSVADVAEVVASVPAEEDVIEPELVVEAEVVEEVDVDADSVCSHRCQLKFREKK